MRNTRPRPYFMRCACPPGTATALGVALGCAISCGYVSPWFAVPFLLVLPIFKPVAGALFLLGLAAGGISGHYAGKPSPLTCLIDRRPHYATIVAVLDDSALTGYQGVPAPLTARAKCRSVKIYNQTRRVTGDLLISVPDGVTLPESGTIIEASGELTPLEDNSMLVIDGKHPDRRRWMSLNAGLLRHYRANGVSAILKTSDFEIVGLRNRPAKYLNHLRRIMLDRMLRGINRDETRKLAAAFFFGSTGGMNRRERNSFVASGTIHLFAISGLHIGLFALLISWLLRPVPYHLRHLFIAVTVWLYVLLTGGNPPAIRAGIMTSLFCLNTACSRYVPPVDLCAMAACVMLLGNPALCGDTGFQYSFVITVIMLLWSENVRALSRMLIIETSIIVKPKYRLLFAKRRRLPRRVLQAVSGVAAAFTSGCGIGVNQGLFLPGSTAANLIMLPCLPLFFLTAAAKILVADCGGTAVAATAFLLDLLFRSLAGISRLSASCIANLPAIAPGLIWTIVFYAALILFIVKGNAVRRLTAAVIAIASLLLWILIPVFTAPRTMVFCSDASAIPTVVRLRPASGDCDLMNTGEYRTALILNAIGRKYGIRQISSVAFAKPQIRYASAAAGVFRNFSVGEMILPARFSAPEGKPVPADERLFYEFLEEKSGRECASVPQNRIRELRPAESAGKHDFAYLVRNARGKEETLTIDDTPSGRSIAFQGRTVKIPYSDYAAAVIF